MDLELVRNTYSGAAVIYDKTAEETVTADINLPDYLPDIVRIISSEMSAGITSCTAASEKVTADGTAVIRILYCCEEGKLHCITQNRDFSLRFDIPGLTAADCVSVSAVTDYLNCRAASQRKAEINGKLSVPLRVTRKTETQVLGAAQNDSIQMLSQSTLISSLTGIAEKTISLSDVFEIPAGSQDIAAVTSAKAYVTVTDIKQISGKVMIRGEFYLDIAYITQGEAQAIAHIKHNLPVNQIIETQGVTENSVCDTDVRVLGVDVQVRAKTDNTMRLIDLSAVLGVNVRAYETQEISVVTDAYCTTCVTQPQYSNARFTLRTGRIDDVYVMREQLDVSSVHVADVSDISCTPDAVNIAFENGRARIDGSLKVKALVTDTQAQTVSIERTADFYCDYPVDATLDSNTGECTVAVAACDSIIISPEKLEIRAELLVHLTTFGLTEERIVTDIAVTGERESRAVGAAVTVYFPSEGERLWDIAKRYNTTVEAIRLENELHDDIQAKEGMMFIPGM